MSSLIEELPMKCLKCGGGYIGAHNVCPVCNPVERVRLLNEAAALTSGDRNVTYGEPVTNMAHIASIYNAITEHNMTAREVAILMNCVKIARRTTSPLHCDSYVDNMAYVGIEWECALAEKGKA